MKLPIKCSFKYSDRDVTAGVYFLFCSVSYIAIKKKKERLSYYFNLTTLMLEKLINLMDKSRTTKSVFKESSLLNH